MASIKGRKLGRHILVDFFGVAPAKLRQRKPLMNVLCAALRKGGFNIIRQTGSHKFYGGGKGVTGFVLLAQSHAAFHTYPEYGYLALDIYSCGTHDPRPIVKAVQAYLSPKRVSRIYHQRGLRIS